jgi:hypothetical protein
MAIINKNSVYHLVWGRNGGCANDQQYLLSIYVVEGERVMHLSRLDGQADPRLFLLDSHTFIIQEVNKYTDRAFMHDSLVL